MECNKFNEDRQVAEPRSMNRHVSVSLWFDSFRHETAEKALN